MARRTSKVQATSGECLPNLELFKERLQWAKEDLDTILQLKENEAIGYQVVDGVVGYAYARVLEEKKNVKWAEKRISKAKKENK